MNTSPFFHLCSLFFTYTRYPFLSTPNPSLCFNPQFAADRARRQEIRSLSLSPSSPLLCHSSFHFNVRVGFIIVSNVTHYIVTRLYFRVNTLNSVGCSSLSAEPRWLCRDLKRGDSGRLESQPALVPAIPAEPVVTQPGETQADFFLFLLLPSSLHPFTFPPLSLSLPLGMW